MDTQTLSNCCGAPNLLDYIDSDEGVCSKCKERSTFSQPDVVGEMPNNFSMHSEMEEIRKMQAEYVDPSPTSSTGGSDETGWRETLARRDQEQDIVDAKRESLKAGGSETPRTDAELVRFTQFDNAFVNEYFARALERETIALTSSLRAVEAEKDALRLQLRDEKHAARNAELLSLTRDIAALTTERDEARAQLKALDAFLYGEQNLSYAPNRVETLETIRKLGEKHREEQNLELSSFRTQLAAVTRERDALKAQLK